MNPHPLLALFSQLIGDFANNLDENGSLLKRIAQSLLQGQTATTLRNTFEFERIQNYTTQYLTDKEKSVLNDILFSEQQSLAQRTVTIQVYLREMPTRTAFMTNSIPIWARAAELKETLGVFKNRDNRRFWLDVYEQMPTPQGIYFQGSTLPALVMSSNTKLVFVNGARGISIIQTQGEGNIWVQARLFVPTIDEKKYIGLRVADAEFNGSPASFGLLTHGRILLQGINPIFSLKMKLRTPSVLGDENTPYGADVRDAKIKLPSSLEMTIQKVGSTVNTVSNAQWTLYGSDKAFKYAQLPVVYNGVLEALAIPMKPSDANFSIPTINSPVFSMAGTASVLESHWLLPLGELTSDRAFRAAGCGMLGMLIGEGLTGNYAELLDANEQARADLTFSELNWITLAPGVLQFLSSSVKTEQTFHKWQLWQHTTEKGNNLQFRSNRKTPMIYQSLASGSETVTSIANCEGQIDRPVGVNKQPIPLKTKNTLWMRTHAATRDWVLAYDENIIRDNAPVAQNPAVVPPLTFKSQSIALNNALLTISPINAFLISGELPPQSNQLTDVSLLYAFALVGYLPTLPDPYSGNVGLYKTMFVQVGAQNGVYVLSNVRRLLVSAMVWDTANKPDTRFIFGDMLSGLENQPLRLNPLDNLNAALQLEDQTRIKRAEKALNRRILRTGRDANNPEQYWSGEYDVNVQVNDRYRNHHFFSLLDVSTAADWMGVNLGFVDERLIFKKDFVVVNDRNPISADGMNVVATGRLVRLFTAPQISWEPLINITKPTNWANDPPAGILTFKDDGPPTLIGNTGSDSVPIAPLPVAEYVVENYNKKPDFKAWSFFNLPFGMLGMARYNQTITIGNTPPTEGAKISLIQKKFLKDVQTGLQISTVGYKFPEASRNFEGMTRQLFNLRGADGNPLDRSILSKIVTEIFNGEFSAKAGVLQDRGVPVERYDFSGYGANLFSHWLNPKAKIAQTSQALFDVWRGRTAHEVIQVRSIVYPWGIRVVRTINIFRNSRGLVYRIDTGWRAESDGIYDFKTTVKDKALNDQEEKPGYVFHSGAVKGVFNVRNIVESDDLAPFERSWFKEYGYKLDDNDGLAIPALPGGGFIPLKLVPVYFDADVQIDNVVQGATDGKVPSKRMLGYLQVAPKGVPISKEYLKELLELQNGLGGPVDCLVNIADSNQTMRISRVEIRPSTDAGQIVFVTAAKGMPMLPKDGSWSVVAHKKATDEVLPITEGLVPLIRRGVHGLPINNNAFELANPAELFTLNAENRGTQYAFLQNTDTQKVLFRNPIFEQGKKLLQSSKPDMADAFRLLNSKGIFPKLAGLPRLDLANFDLNIKDVGYKLLNKLDPAKALEQVLPEGPVYFINEKDVKIYIEYAKKDIKGVKQGDGTQVFDLDSEKRKWVNKMNDVTLVIDLLDMTRLFLIRGKFDTEKGKDPAFQGPELEFGKDLQPVVNILQILTKLQGGDYAGALTKGLKIAMSNSPNNWEYKFQADKEIPVLRFPPPAVDSPTAPLRLECSLKLGCYFNVGMPLPPSGLPTPSGGAFIEFGGKLSVMCLSVAAATVYAVGQCTLRLSADTVRGPGLFLKVGFGVELVVGLPVIGNVSVYYACGVEISIDSRVIIVGAFILFRGRAELIGGLVTIQIQIEAAGKIMRAGGRTDCIAQVTFSLDISIFLVINISFSKTFQENRQIA